MAQLRAGSSLPFFIAVTQTTATEFQHPFSGEKKEDSVTPRAHQPGGERAGDGWMGVCV